MPSPITTIEVVGATGAFGPVCAAPARANDSDGCCGGFSPGKDLRV